MSKLTLYLGVVINLFGLVGYFIMGMISVVYLIPLIFGVPLFLFGYGSKSKRWHKLFMWLALFFSLLSALANWSGFMDLIESISMAKLPALSPILRTIMFFGCSAYSTIVFIYLWKIRKRRKKKNGQSVLEI